MNGSTAVATRDGLRGEQIPLPVRIVAVADSYDAMTSAHVYRPVLPQPTVPRERENGRGVRFDPQVVDAMLTLMDEEGDYRMRGEA